jgi:hypothetical protein
MTGQTLTPQKPLPQPILAVVSSLVRALKTGRLYASGHALFKKNVSQFHGALSAAMGERDFLFLGCARNALFFEGDFFEARDPNLREFLNFFHALGVSHLYMDKKATTTELESLIELLAGAGQGQGEEVVAALPKENVSHVHVGLLDYGVFSSVQSVASSLSQSADDEAIWRQLIIQPAAMGTLHLPAEKIQQLVHLTEDVEDLKKLLLRLDRDMVDRQQNVSAAQRAALLGNFLHNLDKTLQNVDPGKRKPFALQVGAILDTLEPKLTVEILGTPSLEEGPEPGDIVQLILEALSDRHVVYLLIDALRFTGSRSACFNNLFQRALSKYKDAALFLSLIRTEINRATLERKPGMLDHWQHLEQLVVRQQEIEEFNAEYHKQIDALASSIHMKAPLAEDEELERLQKSLLPAPLKARQAQLIIDITSQPHSTQQAETFFPPLLGTLGEALKRLMDGEKHRAVGSLMRDLFHALTHIPHEAVARNKISTWFTTDQVHGLLSRLLDKCRTFDPQEMSPINAICNLFPEKAGHFLLDKLAENDDEDSAERVWLWTTLAGLGSKLNRSITQRLEQAPDEELPDLIVLVSLLGDKSLALPLEELLEHKNHDIRTEAVRTLGRLQAERSVPRLAEVVLQKSLLKSKKTKALQLDAARALAAIGTDQARAVLEQVTEEGSGDLRDLCQELL